jgi:dTDP-4-dehydrorhamnose reductase
MTDRPILVTGSTGQLGRELTKLSSRAAEIVGLSRDDLDVTSREAVKQIFKRLRPRAIINAAAYTAVDKAELKDELPRAHKVNVDAVANIGEEAAAIGARVVHVSTDYVFDGTASTPYTPSAEPRPLSVYGSTKLDGEKALAACGAEALIVRTAWLYAGVGKNFLNTILGLIHSGRDLSIVSDQVSTPTSAADLAPVLLRSALDSGLKGIVHWTNGGVASWYDFAVAIQGLALERSILDKPVRITPTTTADYTQGKTLAPRPAFSVLDSTLLWTRYGKPNDWRGALASVLDSVGAATRSSR